MWLSYHDALSYARWAGVDLPTEAEWLYACRAGSTTKFFWGDVVDDRYVWHRCNTGGTGTRPVATTLPNAWGLYDMVGNAWEYCKTFDNDAYFVLRGASWTRCPQYRTRQGTMTDNLLEEAVAPRCQRFDPNPKFPPYLWDDDRGFRCIRRVPAERRPRPRGPCEYARLSPERDCKSCTSIAPQRSRTMDFGLTDKKHAELEARMAALGLREADLEEKFIHSSGPGGQRVNKTASCVYLKHLPTGLEVKMQQERQQRLNRYYARKRMCELLEERTLGSKSPAALKAEKIRKQKQRRRRRSSSA